MHMEANLLCLGVLLLGIWIPIFIVGSKSIYYTTCFRFCIFSRRSKRTGVGAGLKLLIPFVIVIPRLLHSIC